MKLHEIKKVSKGGKGEKQITLEPAGGIYGEVKFDVVFNVSKGGSSRHGDDASFDEDHPDEYDITSITTTKEVKEYDDDGEKVVKTWPKGTKAEDLPGWDGEDWRAVEAAL